MGIIVPKTEQREFKRVLLPNMIETLLISDENTKTWSAAVSVEVGSLQNPKNILGLAHLLEHMLFLGSSKYPDHSIFGNIVNLGGGFDNAFTSNEETNFYFVSGNNEFEEALDIFSWFFKDPTLDPKSIEKEIQNVNSEHRKNINSDDWRAMNLMKMVGNQSTTYADFTTGTTETLWDIPNNNNIDNIKISLYF